MSNALIALVPILDSTNYRNWKCSMEAYLKSQDLWNVTTGIETSPATPQVQLEDGTFEAVSPIPDYIIAARVKFTTNVQKAAGNIMLCTIPRIQEVIQSMSITDMWIHLETEYSTIGILQVYQEFWKAVTFCIDSWQHPKPQFNAFQGLIDKLGENKIKLDDKLITLILLNSIPCHWEASVLPMVLGIHDVGLLCLLEVKGIITAHYEAEQGHHDKGHIAQKLSAVKRKPTNEPTWQGSVPTPFGSCPPTKGKAPYKKTQRGNHGGKSKQQQKQQCIHLTTCASLPASTTTTVTAIGPSGVNVRTVKAPAPVASGSGGRHESFNDAMSLADCMGVEKTPRVVKMLEERIFTHKLGGKITTGSHHSAPPASASSTVPTQPAPTRCASVTDLTTISDESDIDSNSSKECSSAPPDTTETLSQPPSSMWYQDLTLAQYCDEFLNSERPCIATPEVDYDDDEVLLGDQAEREDFWGDYDMQIDGAAGTYRD
jgi:Domain of unknown function (DUF4219)